MIFLAGLINSDSVDSVTLASAGAALDANLLGVRSTLLKETVQVAANAPGDNRIAQAEQLKSVVADTAALMAVVEQARGNNQQKFAQARQLFTEASRELISLGQRDTR